MPDQGAWRRGLEDLLADAGAADREGHGLPAPASRSPSSSSSSSQVIGDKFDMTKADIPGSTTDPTIPTVFHAAASATNTDL
eukprot:3107865-Pyramimonas_sp.AAC.1